jgi:xanthine dehydrogenase accessory factor
VAISTKQQQLGVIARAWASGGHPFIRVVVVAAEGSTPRETGAAMLVSPDSLVGTIGGGRLEHDAIAVARAMMASGQSLWTNSVALGPAIGQCCGGRVSLRYDRPTEQDIAALADEEARRNALRPVVMIYGAGHVGRALARAMAPLPVRTSLIDSRADELARTDAHGVAQLHSTSPVSLAEAAPDNAAHVVMTHSHALDSLIAATVLERGRFAYLGIIGSKTKRMSFRRAFREMGLPEEAIRRVVCPIGGDNVRDKRPEVIAALVAAEIITVVCGDRTRS